MPSHPITPLGEPVRAGYFGKIPSRGDFVRAGLSSVFVDAWDDWVRRVLPASEHILGDAWDAAWLMGAPWRFVLAPGQCGPRCVLGVWLPSADRIGRPWPLVIAAEGAADGKDFLDHAERLGRCVVQSVLSPEAFAAKLNAVPLPDPSDATATTWWTTSGDRVGLGAHDSLPDTASFAMMLRA